MDTTTERENLLSQLADEYERNLTLLGVTGVEDRLQVIPSFISCLNMAFRTV